MLEVLSVWWSSLVIVMKPGIVFEMLIMVMKVVMVGMIVVMVTLENNLKKIAEGMLGFGISRALAKLMVMMVVVVVVMVMVMPFKPLAKSSMTVTISFKATMLWLGRSGLDQMDQTIIIVVIILDGNDAVIFGLDRLTLRFGLA